MNFKTLKAAAEGKLKDAKKKVTAVKELATVIVLTQANTVLAEVQEKTAEAEQTAKVVFTGAVLQGADTLAKGALAVDGLVSKGLDLADEIDQRAQKVGKAVDGFKKELKSAFKDSAPPPAAAAPQPEGIVAVKAHTRKKPAVVTKKKAAQHSSAKNKF